MAKFNDLVRRLLLCDFIYALVLSAVSAQSQVITILLNKTLSTNNKELYSDYVSIPSNNTVQFDLFIDKINNINVSFVIFQVHSHLHNVTLYNNTNIRGSSLTGTNIGLYSSVNPFEVFFVQNPSIFDLKLLIAVHGYGVKDPIPGGCNMEFSIPVSPFLTASYNKDYILVDGAPAKMYNDVCNEKGPVLSFYRMYLPEQNFNEEIYFEGIKSMMALENILENGDLLPETGQLWSTRRMLGAYLGTGSVYVVVATTDVGYSVYTPTHTYGCDPRVSGGCELLDDVLSQLLCATLCFVGLFVCYGGHRWFKCEMFLAGAAAGALIAYVLLAIGADLDRPVLLLASLCAGGVGGAAWLAAWWLCGLPALSVLLVVLHLGYLAAAILYYRLPGGQPILEQDFNFWILFIFVMLFTALIVMSTTYLSNILCCSILGSYCILIPIDYYVGSNLKYIIINTLRRAVVPKFNFAIVAPPFDLSDALLTALWAGLAATGLLYQTHRARGRPPFPPPPRAPRPAAADSNGSRYRRLPAAAASRPVVHTEATPLLADIV